MIGISYIDAMITYFALNRLTITYQTVKGGV